MNQVSNSRMEASVSYSRIFGEIVSEFAQGMGLIGLMVGLALIAGCVREK